MNATRTIAGYECNCELSKSGDLRLVTILIGPMDRPGARSKDGEKAKAARQSAKAAVIAETGLPRKNVRVVSRYTELRESSNGTVERLGADGRVVGVYLP